MTEPVELYYVIGSDGETVAFGKAQAEFLRDQGRIARTGQANTWRSTTHTATELHAICMAYPELRECDFCSTTPAGFKQECRPFPVAVGPGTAGMVGGPERPMFLCSECAGFARRDDGRGLVEHTIASKIEQVRRMGHHHDTPDRLLAAAVRAMVSATAANMFVNRIGEPTEDG